MLRGGGNDASQDELVGLSSFGTGCGLVNFPGVYTRMSAYREFVVETICDVWGQQDNDDSFCAAPPPPPTLPPMVATINEPKPRVSPKTGDSRFSVIRGGY